MGKEKMIGTARSLMMWDDVVLSGAALGAATVTYILFVWSGYTSMQIFFNTALVGCAGGRQGEGDGGAGTGTVQREGLEQDQDPREEECGGACRGPEGVDSEEDGMISFFPFHIPRAKVVIFLKETFSRV